tara:strand:+ start:28877 stop:29179 length:303 start_codon:yes stop_codon:yes gene_type:complete
MAALSHDQIQKAFTEGIGEVLKLLKVAEEQAQQNPRAAEIYLGLAARRRQQLTALFTHLDTKADEAREAVANATQGAKKAMAENRVIRVKVAARSIRKNK